LIWSKNLVISQLSKPNEEKEEYNKIKSDKSGYWLKVNHQSSKLLIW